MIYTNQALCIFSGDEQTAVYPNRDSTRWELLENIATDVSFSFVPPLFDPPASALVFANQVHGIKGMHVGTAKERVGQKFFTQEADFIHTNQSGVALGILTADCVPVVLYDPLNHAIAIVHAGWRGAVENIVGEVLAALHRAYQTRPIDLQVFIGPSARSCCYKVDEPFVKNISECLYAHNALIKRGAQLFFDISMLIVDQLSAAGVLKESIIADYALCTICNEQFCSYRRQKEDAGRQMTIALLR
jgi:YfiH family protein